MIKKKLVDEKNKKQVNEMMASVVDMFLFMSFVASCVAGSKGKRSMK